MGRFLASSIKFENSRCLAKPETSPKFQRVTDMKELAAS
jgi:hypothetical protein